MDQDSFRQLLQTPRPEASSSTGSRGSLLATALKSKPATASTGVAFKPRKVKKTTTTTGDKYRDRASERRTGDANDYAEVEAVLEDFERRAVSTEDKETVERQRRYLGGDSVHTILVKGLDHSLLEQNKAQAELSTGVLYDDSLEQAFLASSAVPSEPSTERKQKRTREELVEELKSKRREQGPSNDQDQPALDESQQLESAKRAGKFKLIGFTPIGNSAKRKKAKDGTADDEKKKKKKRKIVEEKHIPPEEKQHDGQKLPPRPPPTTISEAPAEASVRVEPKLQPEPELVEDFDIFGGVDDYEGIPLDDDEDSDNEQKTNHKQVKEDLVPANSTGKWFQTSEEERTNNAPAIILPASVLRHTTEASSNSDKPPLVEEQEEEEQVTKLVPLSSSALPSIKDFLAMDRARDKPWKGKKGAPRKVPEEDSGQEPGEEKEPSRSNKNKKGDKGKLSAEAKADRDYKRLRTYEEKKAGGSKNA